MLKLRILSVILILLLLSISASATSYFNTTDDILIDLNNNAFITLLSGQYFTNTTDPVIKVYNLTDTPKSTLEINFNGTRLRLNNSVNTTLSNISYINDNLYYTGNANGGILNTSIIMGTPNVAYSLKIDNVTNKTAISSTTGLVEFNYSILSTHNFEIYRNNAPTIGNSSISTSSIYPVTQFVTITVNDVNDTDNDTLSVLVGISYLGYETNYTMVNTANTSIWTYNFNSGVSGFYTVTSFYANDNYTITKKVVSHQFEVVTQTSGGSSGGGGGVVSTPTPTPVVTIKMPEIIDIGDIQKDPLGIIALQLIIVIGIIYSLMQFLSTSGTISGMVIGLLMVLLPSLSLGYI